VGQKPTHQTQKETTTKKRSTKKHPKGPKTQRRQRSQALKERGPTIPNEKRKRGKAETGATKREGHIQRYETGGSPVAQIGSNTSAKSKKRILRTQEKKKRQNSRNAKTKAIIRPRRKKKRKPTKKPTPKRQTDSEVKPKKH